jgi:hypothetical protein
MTTALAIPRAKPIAKVAKDVLAERQNSNQLEIGESVKAIVLPGVFTDMSIPTLKDQWDKICQYDSILEHSYGEICWLKGKFLNAAKLALPPGRNTRFRESLQLSVSPSTLTNWCNIADAKGDGFTRTEARKYGMTGMLTKLAERRRKAKGGVAGTNNGNRKTSKNPPLKITPSIGGKTPATPAQSNRKRIKPTVDGDETETKGDDVTPIPTIKQVVAQIEESVIASDDTLRALTKASPSPGKETKDSIDLGLKSAKKLSVNADAITKQLEAMDKANTKEAFFSFDPNKASGTNKK